MNQIDRNGPRSTDRLARAAGALYLLTFVTSIPALALKTPGLTAIVSGDELPGGAGLVLSAVLELVLALACAGTGVTLLLVLRRVSAVRGLGFLASRLVEAGLVTLGAVVLLALGAREIASTSSAPALVAVHDAAFLLGPGLLPAVNALLLAPAVVRAGLVPRAVAVIGLLGAPLLLGSAAATLAGVLPQVSPIAGVLALPIAVWELALGLWLLLRGAGAGVGAAGAGAAGVDGSSPGSHPAATGEQAARPLGAAASSS